MSLGDAWSSDGEQVAVELVLVCHDYILERTGGRMFNSWLAYTMAAAWKRGALVVIKVKCSSDKVAHVTLVER